MVFESSDTVTIMQRIKGTIIVLAIILVLAGAYWAMRKPAAEEPTQTGEVASTPTPNPEVVLAEMEKIDPADPNVKVSEELETVTFCGKSYKAKQVMVKNVDVMKRLAELAAPQKTDLQKLLCSVPSDTEVDGIIPVNFKKAVLGPGSQKELMQVVEGEYILELGPGKYGPIVFFVNINQNLIGIAGFTGEEVGPLIK